MGSRGPTPKPAWQKRLEGNPGKRPIKEQLKPDPRRPSCPAWLDEDAKAEWARLAPELEKHELLTHLDRFAFAGYCSAYSVWVRCEKTLMEQGQFYVAGARLRERPEVEMASKARRLTLAFAREFGMTPVSRARLSLPPLDEHEEDEFGQWLNRRSGLLD